MYHNEYEVLIKYIAQLRGCLVLRLFVALFCADLISCFVRFAKALEGVVNIDALVLTKLVLLIMESKVK